MSLHDENDCLDVGGSWKQGWTFECYKLQRNNEKLKLFVVKLSHNMKFPTMGSLTGFPINKTQLN